MARWIDVPAHRVLELSDEEFDLSYERVNADGTPVRFGQQTYRILRKFDGKVFMLPRFRELDNAHKRVVYLEEI